MAMNETVQFEDGQDQLDELLPGSTLLHGQYTITRFLNNGGFGITYLAKDSLDRVVVIKECFADAFCRRTNTIVTARSRAYQNEVKSIVRHFLQEAHRQSKLVHPNIVGVHQVFEDNDTAYMALDYIDGKDLMDILEDPSTTLAPKQIVNLTRKLLDAVGFVHTHGLLHRDISPDNILLRETGEPILIDFGAAREHDVASTRKHSALRVVKDGYSPQEFYIAGSEQGPWSDLYALAATLYHLIKGEAPVNGQQRLASLAEQKGDPYEKLAGNIKGYPAHFLEAVDKALITLPQERLQTAALWLEMLDQDNAQDKHAAKAANALTELNSQDEIEPAPKGKARFLLLGGAVAIAAVGAIAYVSNSSKTAPAAQFSAPPNTPSETTRNEPVVITAPVETEFEMEGAADVFAAVSTAVKAAEAEAEAAKAAEQKAAAEIAALAAAAQKAADAEAAELEAAAAEKARAEAQAAAQAAQAKAAQEAAEKAALDKAAAQAAVAEAAAIETAAAEAAAAAEIAAQKAAQEAALKPLLQQQISFSLWDIEIPFQYLQHSVRNSEPVLITGIPVGENLNSAGDWIAEGVEIFSVNNNPLTKGISFATLLLNDLVVDPDGLMRASVRYKAPAKNKFEFGLIAVPVVRKAGLADGTLLEMHMVNDKWVTKVTEVENEQSNLRSGDTLIAETTTGTALDTTDALERALHTLVARKLDTARIRVRRNGGELTVDVALQRQDEAKKSTLQ